MSEPKRAAWLGHEDPARAAERRDREARWRGGEPHCQHCNNPDLATAYYACPYVTVKERRRRAAARDYAPGRR
jgi:hypothetical protein